MTVKEIIKKHLIDNGYDGLYDSQQGCDCGCMIDDLIPCDGPSDHCYPGYKIDCDHHCDDRGLTHCIGPEKGQTKCVEDDDGLS